MERRARNRRRGAVLLPDLEGFAVGEGLWCAHPSNHDARRDAVRAAVEQSLTDKQREVVQAYFFEGLSQGQIAQRLGITQQVVQKRIFGAQRDGKLVGGALSRLREALANCR